MYHLEFHAGIDWLLCESYGCVQFFFTYCSLRAKFGVDTMKNAVHGSSNVEKAVKVIKEFLPEVEVLPDGTVRGLKLVLFFLPLSFLRGSEPTFC